MASVVDKLREARQMYIRMAEAAESMAASAEAMEQQAASAAEGYRQLQAERKALAEDTRRHREDIAAEILQLRAVLRRPWWVLVPYGLAIAFGGASLFRLSQRFGDWLFDRLAALITGG